MAMYLYNCHSFCGQCRKVEKCYPQSKRCFVDSVDNFSTENVDNSQTPSACVDSVDNFSTENVDNSQSLIPGLSTYIDMWKLWISYPQKMWITL